MFEGSQAPVAFCPRIYYLHPRLAGPLADWPGHFAHIARLGFDHVMLPLPAASGPSLRLIEDYDRPHPALVAQGDLNEVLARIAALAKKNGLQLLIDIVLDRVAREGRYARQHAEFFASTGKDLPDPRLAAEWLSAAAVQLQDPWVLARVLGDWGPRLQAWVKAGVAGFQLQAPQVLPASFTAPLMALVRSERHTRFIAATAGLDWNRHADLQGLGYDAVIGSCASWDFRSDWMLEEHRRLSAIAPLITAPELPFAARIAARETQAARAAVAAERSLRLAASTGCGWLMPAGFEYGLRETLPLGGGKPMQLAEVQQRAAYDLSAQVIELNHWISREWILQQPAVLTPISAASHGLSVLLRTAVDAREARSGLLIAANADLVSAQALGADTFTRANSGGLVPVDSLAQATALAPGELRCLPVSRPQAVISAAPTGERAVDPNSLQQPRVCIESISPSVDGGEHAVKRIVGDRITVEADVFMDGHDHVAVSLLWRPEDENSWHELPMRALGNDRWTAEFRPARLGRHRYTVQGWRDDWASYRHEIEKKQAAGLIISSELREGLQKLESAAAAVKDATLKKQLAALAQSLAAADDAQRYRVLQSGETAALMQAADVRAFAATQDPALILDVEPPMAAYASWYELFPRSMSGDGKRHGSLRDVIPQLPRIHGMGFDVLYFPPIHPIGRSHRKGRNNSLKASADDPGSPYAIGAAEGGFEAIDPRLGTLEDFRALHDAAREQGLQLALDFAVQCSPDHPWLKDHPEWFAWRPDGTIKYAENPPKKYEDIVNVDFYAKGAMPGLWLALRDAVLFWCREGVRLFRVDNPHTKPLPFWQWLIADVRGRHPDAVFLAEAFTRPKLMRRLAKIGFSQSYTYFTWRNGKAELSEYLTELTQTEMREYFRPHFFVNTPDINPLFLQTSGRAGFVIRAALAATLSGLWGVYSGFELCEAAALPGKEEYLDSEKYQLRAWDWDRPGNISGEITLLNRLRRQHPALQTHLGLSFLKAWNEQVLVYCKATADRSDVLLIAVSLDPHHAQEADFEIPLWDFGLPDHGALAVEDRVKGARFNWQGKIQHLRLTPDQPFAIWRLTAPD